MEGGIGGVAVDGVLDVTRYMNVLTYLDRSFRTHALGAYCGGRPEIARAPAAE